jgi:hypothetical protein
MRRKQILAWLGTALGLFAAVAGAGAQECSCEPEQGCHRERYVPGVACYAVPSDTGHYVGYYVGGGAPCFGDPPCPDEGTWGWDYHGCLLPKKVILGWWHGRRYQGGIGAYRTAGPNCSSTSTP